MKVLVISQMVFNKTNNMGKTLMSYFKGWNPQNLAQLYFHSFDPTDVSICENYYRFSDVDVVKSIVDKRVVGRSFCRETIQTQESEKRIDEGFARKAYIIGEKHHAWAVIVRDFAWRLGNWKNKNLVKWVEKFNPDVFFFASGDCEFSYRIALWLSEYFKKPLVTLCVDDYYIHNRNETELFGNYRYKHFMKIAERTLRKSSLVLTICDSMKKEYEMRFGVNCKVLHTAARYKQLEFIKKPFRVAYFGNLDFGRNMQLVSIGRAISCICKNVEAITFDVYSGSIAEDLISVLKQEKGICFHGAISPSDVEKRMQECVAVIHTESFDEEIKDQVRFSVSTKIAESLMYGPCIIAYGPDGIASIDYLKENHAAYVITRPEDLQAGLEEILTNKRLREQIIKNARVLAIKNHNEETNSKRVRDWLEKAIDY